MLIANILIVVILIVSTAIFTYKFMGVEKNLKIELEKKQVPDKKGLLNGLIDSGLKKKP